MIEGDPSLDKLTRLENGIQLKGYRTLPASSRPRTCLLDPSLLPRMDQLPGSRSNCAKARSAKYDT